ncbi:hypothetical protein DW322_07660 [Rhodococcus rhodnii]|uniref:Uncharacterized protein n=1 Tax=Rhodococcus rhodnii TaxID=38312 RepID=A0A6P2CBI7_9NOCA|nr:hypothetical protein DW322_07660 [Rhodococcus rhodnii]
MVAEGSAAALGSAVSVAVVMRVARSVAGWSAPDRLPQDRGQVRPGLPAVLVPALPVRVLAER